MYSIEQYLNDVEGKLQTGKAREHTYRGHLESLMSDILGKDFAIINEPARIECGSPDLVVQKEGISRIFIEAKDVGRLDNLNPTEKAQYKRYTDALDNLIYTDYLEFKFIRRGEIVTTIKLAELEGDKLEPLFNNFGDFKNQLVDFSTYTTQTIKSAEKLSEMMASKAVLMKEIFLNILKDGEESSLHDQYEAFKTSLIHDITHEDFASVYAETIAYGLFTARLHDPTLDTFSRGEAYELIPKSNPFLRKLFTYIATELDDRATWVVDELCRIFLATDVKKMLGSFNRTNGRKDPFIHFYETFLAKYDPAKRKACGVWYTPESVVKFIVRAVDDVLKEHFSLPMGLADSSKTKIMVDTQTRDKRTTTGYAQIEKEVHKVQILDVATGTGTFLAETISQIHDKFQNNKGMWSDYVDEHLIPRIHGFELLMASYAMCHMKLDLLLSETGYKPTSNKQERLHVYLTNSLEEAQADTDKLRFEKWFSDEVNEASKVKRENPIMITIGNPPYSGISNNMGDGLIVDIEDYKYVDGVHFGERKHWLHDDYVKFIRLGEHFIDKNGEGVLAYITSHGYLDNPTFRGMRWHLLNTFDDIYIIDLHGNSKKKETCPDGSPDVNVFDIMQGVSIIIGVKHGNNPKKLAKVHHADVWGKRKEKYGFLDTNTIESVNWQKLEPQNPMYFFVPKDMGAIKEYEKGFAVNEMLTTNVTGVVTARDGLVIADNDAELKNRIQNFCEISKTDEEIRHEFFPNKKDGKYLAGDSRGWKLADARMKIQGNNHDEIIQDIAYRPFDSRSIYYTSDMVDWGREKFMTHMLANDNLGLNVGRQGAVVGSMEWNLVYANKGITDFNLFYRGGVMTHPLYLYEEEMGQLKKRPNLDADLWAKLNKKAKKETTPEQVFDYIYAVLHSPTYREKYKEFLKSDFPRIPYPKDEKQFEVLVEQGSYLRQLHLLEHADCDTGGVSYPVGGSHIVEQKGFPRLEGGKVYINKEQYFENVPEIAWDFYIGGYQPAQKWLKDRKGRSLTMEDITHYGRIISTLTKTHEVMQKIDEVYDV